MAKTQTDTKEKPGAASHADTGEVTMGMALDTAGFGKFQLWVFLIVGTSQLADGMEMLIISFLYLPLKEIWGLDNTDLGMVASGSFFGVFAGALVFGHFGDTRGRRITIVTALAFVATFGLLSSLSRSMWDLLFCRFMVGFGFGGVGPNTWTLLSEFLPAKVRGKTLIFCGQAWAIGQMLEAGIAAVVLGRHPETTWRQFVAISSIPAFLSFFFCLKWLPDSPRFLAITGKQERLEALLREVAATNGTLTEFEGILAGHRLATAEVNSRGHITDLLRKRMIMGTIGVWTMWFACNFTFYGMVFIIPAIATHLTDENEMALVDDHVYATSFIFALIELPGSLLAAYLADAKSLRHVGRRSIIMGLTLLTSITCALVTTARSPTVQFTYIIMAKLFTNAVVATQWAYTAELYPTAIRSTGMGAASAAGRIAGILSPLIMGQLSEENVILCYMSFAIVLLIAVLGGTCAPRDFANEELVDTVEGLLEHEKDETEQPGRAETKGTVLQSVQGHLKSRLASGGVPDGTYLMTPVQDDLLPEKSSVISDTVTV